MEHRHNAGLKINGQVVSMPIPMGGRPVTSGGGAWGAYQARLRHGRRRNPDEGRGGSGYANPRAALARKDGGEEERKHPQKLPQPWDDRPTMVVLERGLGGRGRVVAARLGLTI